MSRPRFSWFVVLSLVLSAANTQIGWSQDPKPATPPLSFSSLYSCTEAKPACKNDLTCIVYSLNGLGDDPNLGKWIAETIPQVIQPGTWNQEGVPWGAGKCRLSYYAQGKILVVYHSPAVQNEVTAFLRNIKVALPQEKEFAASPTRALPMTQDRPLIQAAYATPYFNKTPDVVPMPKSSYPVPPPLQQPKHLFHLILQGEGFGASAMPALLNELTGVSPDKEDAKAAAKSEAVRAQPNPTFTFILRYEGDGIIDSNVADVLKEIYGSKQNESKETGNCRPGTVLPCLPGVLTGSGIGAASSSGFTPPASVPSYAVPVPATPQPGPTSPEISR